MASPLASSRGSRRPGARTAVGATEPGRGRSRLRSVVSSDPVLTLPHPRAHLRAFVLVPWLDVEPDATLIVDGQKLPVAQILDGLDRTEREGVRTTDVVLAR